MPFDGRNFETKPERKEPSLEDFAAWLARQPAYKTYEWGSCEHCAVGRYMADQRLPGEDAADAYVRFHNAISSMDDVGLTMVHLQGPWTMGAAAKRARALLRETAAAE